MVRVVLRSVLPMVRWFVCFDLRAVDAAQVRGPPSRSTVVALLAVLKVRSSYVPLRAGLDARVAAVVRLRERNQLGEQRCRSSATRGD